MTNKILKSTDRGQITLPKQWRERFPTDSYIVEMHQDKLIVIPFQLDEIVEDEILFDAHRDNAGKGISPDDIIKALKKMRHG